VKNVMILILMLLILAQTALADEWPMFRHDLSHSGTTDEIVKPPLMMLWKYHSIFDYSSPAVSEGMVRRLSMGSKLLPRLCGRWLGRG